MSLERPASCGCDFANPWAISQWLSVWLIDMLSLYWNSGAQVKGFIAPCSYRFTLLKTSQRPCENSFVWSKDATETRSLKVQAFSGGRNKDFTSPFLFTVNLLHFWELGALALSGADVAAIGVFLVTLAGKDHRTWCSSFRVVVICLLLNFLLFFVCFKPKQVSLHFSASTVFLKRAFGRGLNIRIHCIRKPAWAATVLAQGSEMIRSSLEKDSIFNCYRLL